MMYRQAFKLFIALALILGSGAGWTLDLQEAKQRGLVGEQRDGYIGAVGGKPSAEVSELISSINAERRMNYQRIAERNKLQLNQVERLAAEKAIEKTDPGAYVQDARGAWTRK